MNDAERRQRNLAVVQAFYDRLEAMDIDGWAALWAEDGRQEMPFAPRGFPNKVEGKGALHQHYSGLPQAYSQMRFVDRVMHEMLDPDWVAIEYRGLIDVKATGRPYNNTYLGLFHLEGGKIKLFREFFNPTVLSEALGDALGSTFSLSKG